MLIKIMSDYKQYRRGRVVDVEISEARLLIKQGRATLASSQEQHKKLKNEQNKMVKPENINNKGFNKAE